MKQTTQVLLLFFALLLVGLPVAQAQDYYRSYYSSQPKVSFGVNAYAVPSAELGFGLTDRLSLHVKGGYLPDLVASAKYDTELLIIEPSVKWWQGNDRFEGMYVEFGAVYSKYNLRLPHFNSRGLGEKGSFFGVDAGVGYLFALGDHFRLGLNLNLVAMVSFPTEYRVVEDGVVVETRPVERSRMNLPMWLPTNTGISLSYVF